MAYETDHVPVVQTKADNKHFWI